MTLCFPLPHSRAFQRFAIRTNAMFEEMKTKGAEGTLEKGSEVAQTTLSQALNFFQSFKNELSGAARK